MHGTRRAALKHLAKPRRPVKNTAPERKSLPDRAGLEPQPHNEAKQFTNKMIQLLAQPPKKLGQEQSDRALLGVVKSRLDSAPSLEQQQFNELTQSDIAAHNAVDLDLDSTEKLPPGTFVELRRNDLAVPSVILTSMVDNGIFKYVCLIYSGETWATSPDDVSFIIPSFTPPDLSLRCGLTVYPETDTELHARVEVLKRIRALDKVVEQSLQDVRSGETDAYSTFRSKDPESWSTVTISEVAKLWKPRPTLSTMYAAHKYLMQYPLYFLASPDHRLAQTFSVRPQAEVGRIVQVTAWTREKNSPVSSFIQKAKRIVASNAPEIKQSLRNVEPPSWTPNKNPWSDEDKIILQFMLESLRPVRGDQRDPYELPLGFILRSILSEVEELTDAVVHQFLVDVGVLAPWQELLTIRPDVSRLFGSQEVEKNAKIASKALQDLTSRRSTTSARPKDPHDLHAVDPLESVRHDFGNMPVYVIDDPSAQELDDGISIEPVASRPDQYWIHSHIADPCSLLPPGHVFSQEAYYRQETAYLRHVTIPLLPTPMLYHDQIGLSLSPRDPNYPHRVLTFSIRLKTNGTVLESKVRAGVVRNVIRATYDDVDAALGHPLGTMHYPFGGAPAPASTRPLSEQAKKDLSILDTLAVAVITNRLGMGVFNTSKERANLIDAAPPLHLKTPSMEGGMFRGYPEMVYAVGRSAELDRGARAIVGEVMKLSARAMSLFALERGLPAIRRVAARPILEAGKTWEDLLSLRRPNGYIEWKEAIPFMALESLADYSLEPGEHFSLGMKEGEGYCRVTSPLRRHSDMVLHWQIHSALLNSQPAFPADWMRKYLQHLQLTERIRKRALGMYETFLAVSFVKRWMEDPARRQDRPDPLQNLQVFVYREPIRHHGLSKRWMTAGLLEGLGLRAILALDGPEVKIGDVVPVQITSIQTGVLPSIELQLR